MKLVHSAMGLGIVMACTSSAGLVRAQTCPQWVNECSNNYINTLTTGATVSGGEFNSVSGSFATIAGGNSNEIALFCPECTLSGGNFNNIGYYSQYSTIGGGIDNAILTESSGATICGGNGNTVWGAPGNDYAYTGTIAGGTSNAVGTSSATYSYQTVGGGISNWAVTNYTSILGGEGNTASQDYASILGGHDNVASAGYASVLGGRTNTASGVASVAGGYNADANANGCVVFSDTADGTNATSCTVGSSTSVANAFVVRATGGIELITGWSTTTGAPTEGLYLAHNSQTWEPINASDQRVKQDILEVDPKDVLARLAAIPVATWRYDDADGPSAPHMGPMAQDFYAAFQLGGDDRRIEGIDEGGVAIAAIQGLYAEVLERDRTIDAMRAHEASLEKANAEASREVATLEQRLAAIEARLALTR